MFDATDDPKTDPIMPKPEQAIETAANDLRKATENYSHSELRRLLGNAIHIFAKIEHFTEEEIDVIARWIHERWRKL